MFRLRTLTFTLGIAGMNIFCSNLFANSNSTDRIIGANDLVKITAKDADNSLVKAIGRMQLGCTVTHVGNGIAITAGHCFARNNFEGVRQNLPCSDSKYNTQWGFTYNLDGTGEGTSYLQSECVEIIATEMNIQRDYAIFRVSPIPPAHLEPSLGTAEIGTKISIYSHPKKRPLEWSTWCTVEGFVKKSKDNQFYYSCDTEGGSSGAAVLDRDLRIVGIHNYYTDRIGGRDGRNGATHLSVTPLQNILMGGTTNPDESDGWNY